MNSTDPDKRKEPLHKAAHYRNVREAAIHSTHDPDWWLKSLIEREKITGLAPEAFLLRREDAEMDERLAACHSEQEVRQILQDFNRRIIEARRQLEGGPPVVTPLRDVDQAVQQWRTARPRQARATAEEVRRRPNRGAAEWIARLKRRARGRR